MRSRALLILSTLQLLLLAGLWQLGERLAERVWWVTVIAYVPQHPLVVIPLVLFLWSLLRRDARALLLNILAVLGVLVGFMGLALPFGSGHRLENAQPLRLMTYNIRQSVAAGAVMRQSNPDVICVQESRDLDGLLGRLQRELPGYNVVHDRELTVFSKFPIRSSQVHRLDVSFRPLLEVTLDVRGTPFTVVNAHFNTLDIQGLAAPNISIQERIRLNSLARWDSANTLLKITQTKHHALALCGDFNTPPRGSLYRALTAGLEDAFKVTGSGFGFSYRSDLPVIRIDHVFVNRLVQPTKARVLETTASDHRPLLTELRIVSSR